MKQRWPPCSVTPSTTSSANPNPRNLARIGRLASDLQQISGLSATTIRILARIGRLASDLQQISGSGGWGWGASRHFRVS